MKEGALLKKLESICLTLFDLKEKNIFLYGKLYAEANYMLGFCKKLKGNWADDVPSQAFTEFRPESYTADSYRKFLKALKPILKKKTERKERGLF